MDPEQHPPTQAPSKDADAPIITSYEPCASNSGPSPKVEKRKGQLRRRRLIGVLLATLFMALGAGAWSVFAFLIFVWTSHTRTFHIQDTASDHARTQPPQ